MRVVNKENGNVISDVERMSSVLEKSVGLRFRREGRAWFAFDGPTRQPIDMVCVPRPLDIAFLDGDMEIMEIHGAFPVTLDPVTWRLYRPDDPYRYVLEVEKELLPECGFAEGDTVKIVD